jgi:Fic family protein
MLSAQAGLAWPLDISTYIKQRQLQYYNRLFKVSTCNEWNRWFEFVLGVIRDAADNSTQRIRRLRLESERCKKMANTSNGVALVDMLVERPMVTVPQIRSRLGMSYPGAKNLAEAFVDLGILAEAPATRRPRLFLAPRILDLVGG